MIIKNIMFIGCISFLTACATNDGEKSINDKEMTAETASSENANGLRCKNETVTGSRFPVKRCTTAAQRARELDDAKKVLNDARNNVGNQQ